MRKCFEKEFSSIYVFNLRGNQRTSGETSRKEGGKIFGSGSRAPIAITVLVKKPKQEGGKATIYYREVDDYLTREDKLDEVKKVKSVGNSQFTQKVLKPNEAGDWLNQRSELFTQFTVIGDKKGKDTGRTIFTSNYSCGVQSNRDAWVYNFSSCKLESTSKRMVENYNEQVNVYETYHDKEKLSYDTHYIKWTSSLMPQLLKGKYSHYKTNAVVLTQYRPFEKQFLYFDFFLFIVLI